MGGGRAKGDKKPVPGGNPPASRKQPRLERNPASIESEYISWQVQSLDLEGPYGWAAVGRKVFWEDIWPKILNFETQTWGELKGRQSHFVARDRLSREARKRLEVLGQDDVDELFSLRLSGRQRLWGIVDRHVFKMLWFDSDHAVCPSLLKHT